MAGVAGRRGGVLRRDRLRPRRRGRRCRWHLVLVTRGGLGDGGSKSAWRRIEDRPCGGLRHGRHLWSAPGTGAHRTGLGGGHGRARRSQGAARGRPSRRSDQDEARAKRSCLGGDRHGRALRPGRGRHAGAGGFPELLGMGDLLGAGSLPARALPSGRPAVRPTDRPLPPGRRRAGAVAAPEPGRPLGNRGIRGVWTPCRASSAHRSPTAATAAARLARLIPWGPRIWQELRSRTAPRKR